MTKTKYYSKLSCLILISSIILVSISIPSQANARKSSKSSISTTNRNNLYLYFPTTSDSTFPDFTTLVTASPAEPFDVVDLDSGIGTTANLRDRVFEVVKQDYVEFDVGVTMSTTLPAPTDNRWQIVAIGSDSKWSGDLFGVAQDVDIGDSNAQDYARVWAGSFADSYGGTGGALEGADSTLDRWAIAIGETTAHEAAHNYGLSHSDSSPRAGSAEDDTNNHTLATGSTGLNGEMRAGVNRHFSDKSYEILGHNIGLNVKTVHNWDFVNPNDQDGYGLRMKILSKATSLSLKWVYTGPSCPWENPTISALELTETFQGVDYNVFELLYSDAKSWNGGSDGIVPPGIRFHVGASFHEPDAIIVTESRLIGSDCSELPLSPRICGYDAGEIETSTGNFILRFFNPFTQRLLILRDIIISFIPRMADINSMIENAELIGMDGLPISVIDSFTVNETEITESFSIRIAHLTDPRNVDNTYGEHGGPLDTIKDDLDYDPNGTALSLFPSTYVYITATIVDPEATYWDPVSSQLVNGSLESKLFYQFSGIKPDFNNNGIDDLIDIRLGTSNDDNENGVPDEAETTDGTPGFSLFFSLMALLTILTLIRRRKK